MEWSEHLQLANWLRAAACASGAYLIGCFITGYYLVRARMGQDVRETGSGSAGARNVGRLLGRTGFMLTTAGDFIKGALAVWLAHEFSHDDFSTALALPAVVAGHLWPVQLKFRGGKGVITSLGALLVFDYRLALTFAVSFGIIFVFTRRTLLPAMFAFLCLPAAGWFFAQSNPAIAAIAVLSFAVIFAHRRNLAEALMELKTEPPKL
jgi:glycerol-3-phosphate acyltransferase PlsY